jgi:hypothetical protein
MITNRVNVHTSEKIIVFIKKVHIARVIFCSVVCFFHLHAVSINLTLTATETHINRKLRHLKPHIQ